MEDLSDWLAKECLEGGDMQIKYTATCHKHGIEIEIACFDADEGVDTINFDVNPCPQCQSEAYEKGIESVLAKGYSRNEGEI